MLGAGVIVYGMHVFKEMKRGSLVLTMREGVTQEGALAWLRAQFPRVSFINLKQGSAASTSASASWPSIDMKLMNEEEQQAAASDDPWTLLLDAARIHPIILAVLQDVPQNNPSSQREARGRRAVLQSLHRLDHLGRTMQAPLLATVILSCLTSRQWRDDG